jgi:two-component system, cell cycle sensor histidine kinase and response regulator CckA
MEINRIENGVPMGDEKLELRKKAEEKLKKNAKGFPTLSMEEKDHLFHELQVHQIELEMQNEELRRAQLELEAARNEYSDLYDFAPVGYFTVSEKGMIAAVNLTGASMLGVERQRLIGNPFSHFVHKEDQDIYYFHKKALLEEMSQTSCELRLMGKEGYTFHAHLNCAPVQTGGGKVRQIRVAVSDITEQEEMKNQLRQALKMESIGTLSGGIAHDFNNILSIIVGNAELAMEEVPEKNGAHSNLKEIRNACLRAAKIVKQLLNFSRKTGQELRPSKMTAMVEETLRFLRSAIPSTIEIQTNMTAAHDVVLADPVQINEIILNLCINASHAMELTGGVLETTVENAMLTPEDADRYPDLPRGHYVKVMVSDTGSGIGAENIDRIFDPYFTTKEIGKGTGMGLSVVHGIVKNHNGAISVESEPGKGAVFTILLPAAAGKPEIETETLGDLPTGNETLLFVDDEEPIVRLAEQLLGRIGYRVVTKMSPVEALEAFRSNPDHFHAVITDMTMPQMTGDRLAQKLMEIRKDIPIIICTGYSVMMDAEQARAAGIAAYLMKPVDMREMAQTLRKVLDRGP